MNLEETTSSPTLPPSIPPPRPLDPNESNIDSPMSSGEDNVTATPREVEVSEKLGVFGEGTKTQPNDAQIANISFPIFEQCLKQLWSPSSGMIVSDLLNNYFLVRFELDSDLKGALTGGPWTIFGHYMMVKRGRFARVCVELDLTKSLRGDIFLNGERLQVEYESLHLICFLCGRYGHDCDHCPTAKEISTLGGCRCSSCSWVLLSRGREVPIWGVWSKKRLDCVFLNVAGRLRWSEAFVQHLPRFYSDHNLLLIPFNGRTNGSPQRRTCVWLSHPNFNEFLASKWKTNDELPNALESLKHTCVVGIGKCLDMCMKGTIPCHDSWIRRRSNRILALKTEWCVNPLALETHALNYFRSMYAPSDLGEDGFGSRSNQQNRPDQSLRIIFGKTSIGDISHLSENHDGQFERKNFNV
ncbi:hypothetical protein V2J09_021058 [Rumex salicifolius]